MSHLSTVMRLLLVFGSSVSWGCSIQHREDFSIVKTADRIEVLSGTADRIATITDAAKVKTAAEFILAHPDGWSEPLAGGAGTRLQLQFFRGSESLRAFGMSHNYLTDGSLSRPTPPEQIEALMRQLDLQWPKR